jgi:hypothetical protein
VTVDYFVEGRGKEALKVKRVKIKLHPKIAAHEPYQAVRMDDRAHAGRSDDAEHGSAAAGMTVEQRAQLARDLAARARLAEDQRNREAEDTQGGLSRRGCRHL